MSYVRRRIVCVHLGSATAAAAAAAAGCDVGVSTAAPRPPINDDYKSIYCRTIDLHRNGLSSCGMQDECPPPYRKLPSWTSARRT